MEDVVRGMKGEPRRDGCSLLGHSFPSSGGLCGVKMGSAYCSLNCGL